MMMTVAKTVLTMMMTMMIFVILFGHCLHHFCFHHFNDDYNDVFNDNIHDDDDDNGANLYHSQTKTMTKMQKLNNNGDHEIYYTVYIRQYIVSKKCIIYNMQ